MSQDGDISQLTRKPGKTVQLPNDHSGDVGSRAAEKQIFFPVFFSVMFCTVEVVDNFMTIGNSFFYACCH